MPRKEKKSRVRLKYDTPVRRDTGHTQKYNTTQHTTRTTPQMNTRWRDAAPLARPFAQPAACAPGQKGKSPA